MCLQSSAGLSSPDYVQFEAAVDKISDCRFAHQPSEMHSLVKRRAVRSLSY